MGWLPVALGVVAPMALAAIVLGPRWLRTSRERRLRTHMLSGRYLEAAELLDRLGRADEAIDALMMDGSTLAVSKLTLRGAHGPAAELLLKKGEYVEAAARYEQAGEIDKAIDALLKGGRRVDAAELLFVKQRWEEGVEMFRQLGELPRAAELLRGYGRTRDAARILHETGEREQAFRTMAETLEKNEPARAAPIFEALGETSRAVDCWKRAGEVGRAAGLLEKNGRAAEAADLFEEVGDKRAAAAVRARQGEAAVAANLYREQGDLDAAADVLRAAGEYTLLGEVLLEAGDPAAASAALAHVAPGGDDSAHAARLRAQAFEELADEAGALAAYRDYLAEVGFTSDSAPAAVRAAELCVSLKNPGGAETVVQELRRRMLVTPRLSERVGRVEEQIGAGMDEEENTDASRETGSTGSLVPPMTRPENAIREGLLSAGIPLGEAGMSAESYPGSGDDAHSDRSADSDLTPGKTASALPEHPRYRFEREIGVGGMGAVYTAWDTERNERIVIKLLRNTVLSSDEAKDYFLRESLLVSYLRHPNIVTVYDYGELHGHPYLAMELVPGADLRLILKRAPSKRLPIHVVVAIFDQIAAALDHAHGQKIVHRDVKLGNVMVTPTGIVKLLDFGLAKAVRGPTMRAERVIGTPRYMAPEAIRREDIDLRVDVYAVGVLLYRMLTGKYPFGGKDVLDQHLHREPRDPSLVFDGLPVAAGGVILRCLEKSPERRFSSVGHVANALRKAARDD